MDKQQMKELIRSVVEEMYSEIAHIAKESANATGNIAGFDTKVWGEPKKRKYSLLDDVEDLNDKDN
jgi:hypothetical protein